MQVPLISVDLWCACTTIQAALGIRCLGIRGFDYLRSWITRENRHFGAKLGLNWRVLVFTVQNLSGNLSWIARETCTAVLTIGTKTGVTSCNSFKTQTYNYSLRQNKIKRDNHLYNIFALNIQLFTSYKRLNDMIKTATNSLKKMKNWLYHWLRGIFISLICVM
jgi:hypothetical protein